MFSTARKICINHKMSQHVNIYQHFNGQPAGLSPWLRSPPIATAVPNVTNNAQNCDRLALGMPSTPIPNLNHLRPSPSYVLRDPRLCYSDRRRFDVKSQREKCDQHLIRDMHETRDREFCDRDHQHKNWDQVNQQQHEFPDQINRRQHEFRDQVYKHEFRDHLNPQHDFRDHLNPQHEFRDHLNPQHEFRDHLNPQHEFRDHLNPQHEFRDQLNPQHEFREQLNPQHEFRDYRDHDQWHEFRDYQHNNKYKKKKKAPKQRSRGGWRENWPNSFSQMTRFSRENTNGFWSESDHRMLPETADEKNFNSVGITNREMQNNRRDLGYMTPRAHFVEKEMNRRETDDKIETTIKAITLPLVGDGMGSKINDEIFSKKINDEIFSNKINDEIFGNKINDDKVEDDNRETSSDEMDDEIHENLTQSEMPAGKETDDKAGEKFDEATTATVIGSKRRKLMATNTLQITLCGGKRIAEAIPTKEVQINEKENFFCQVCDAHCTSKEDFKSHNESESHLSKTEGKKSDCLLTADETNQKGGEVTNEPFCQACEQILRSPKHFIRHCETKRHRDNKQKLSELNKLQKTSFGFHADLVGVEGSNGLPLKSSKQVTQLSEVGIDEPATTVWNKDVEIGKWLIIPLSGLFCKACKRYYEDPDRAMKHCRTLTHFENYQKVMERKRML